MSLRPDLVALSADLAAHLARVSKEMADIEALAGGGAPDRTTAWAITGHLQAFYTGCEVIVRRVVERFEGVPPHGPDSHVRLLQVAVLDVPGARPRVLREETAWVLDAYRAFRQFFRHGYGVELEWRTEAKVLGIRAATDAVARDVAELRSFLDVAAQA
jgi:hypothetical protein